MKEAQSRRVFELLRTGRGAEARSLLAAPAGGGAAADADAILRTAERVSAASAALRSGRVPELAREAVAAAESAPPSPAWLLLSVGSVLQAAYRFTADPALRERALDVLGRLADGRGELADYRDELAGYRDELELAVRARALMGNVHMLNGALYTAADLFAGARDLATSAGISGGTGLAMAHQFRGYILFEWNRREEARAALDAAWAAAEPDDAGVRSGVARMMARVLAAEGDVAGARRWVRRLGRLMAGPISLRNREWLAAVRVGHEPARAEVRRVREWLATYDYSAAKLLREGAGGVLARLQELDQVLSLLEASAQWSEVVALAPHVARAAAAERPWFAARAGGALALALDASGRRVEADASFVEALRLGERGGFVRAYIEGHPRRGELLARAARRRGPARAEATRVIEAAPELCRRRSRVPLTPTQIEILRRVAEGDSNKAVARARGVSVSTVKTHLRAAFARLEARSRTQAVARAREHGLI